MPFGFGRGGRKGGWGKGKRFGKGRGLEDFGPGRFPSDCICPRCGLIEPHQLGIPCFRTKCPRCGSPMTRTFPREEQKQ